MNERIAPLLSSFLIQKRVINALILREIITRYGRHNVGFFWLFLEPMMFTLGITTLWSLIDATHGSNIPIAAFAITGYSSILLWRNCSSRVIKAIEANLSLMYHRNVRVIDIFTSRLILEIAGATASLIVLTLIFSAVGLMNLPEDLLTVALGWFLLAWFAFSLSLLIGAASERVEIIERIWHIVTYLTFPLSGAAFMVDWLPKGAREFVLWVPMVHGTEMIRHGYFGSMIQTYENPYYFAMFNAVLTLAGLALVKNINQLVEPE